MDRLQRPCAHSVAWRDPTEAKTVAALGAVRAGAATARTILGSAITHRTAAGYNRQWVYYADFCSSNKWPALPTTDAAISCYFATMCERGLKPATMRAYLTAVNNMHAAKGFDKPAAGPLLAKLRKGWARLAADKTNSLPAARGPLSPEHAWDIVKLATRAADPEWRRQLTAILIFFLVCRRTTEVIELQFQDILVLKDGAFHINVNRYKNAEGRDDPRRLAYSIPRDPKLSADPVLSLLRAMRDELVAEAAPPNRLVFSTPSVHRAPTVDDVTLWLLKAMAALGAAPPPGVLYSSYSCRAGGATALHVIGVPMVAVAAMLGRKDNKTRTAIAKYVSVLAPISSAALRLCGRWLRAAL